MKKTTLHYIYDPLCGWCYAAAPLISAARTVDGLSIQAHAGGMWTGANVKRFTPELRAMVVRVIGVFLNFQGSRLAMRT